MRVTGPHTLPRVAFSTCWSLPMTTLHCSKDIKKAPHSHALDHITQAISGGATGRKNTDQVIEHRQGSQAPAARTT